MFGYFSHPTSCNLFIICSNNNPVIKSCPTGLVYNANLQTCDYNSPTCPKYDYYKAKKMFLDLMESSMF